MQDPHAATVTPPTGLPVVPDVPPWRALEAAGESVGIAREHTQAVLHGDTLAEDALRVVSELVTNAVVHRDDDYEPRRGVAPPIILSIQAERRWVLVAVRDPWRGLPIERDPTDTDESGRGLLIVHALVAARWVEVDQRGHKTVYALLLRPGASLAPGELWRLRHP